MTRRRSRWLQLLLLLAAIILTAVGGAVFSYAIDRIGIAPRQLSPYIERRAEGYDPTIVAFGHWASEMLLANDRGPASVPPRSRLALRLGAQPIAAAANHAVREVPVSSAAAALAAIAQAAPGDAITFAPGRYRLAGTYFSVDRPGTAQRRIVVRAAQPGTVTLVLDTSEGFLVTAPYWQFENLTITGACADDSDCEHAFHVVGNGTNFIARNNTISDFNAHFKINGNGQAMPDDGLIEGNTLSNSHVRRTGNAVTPIDLVAASNWIIRRNVISDFIKGGGDQTSYGGFAKGGGGNNLFENNIILCEYMLRSAQGARVGLSLGGGGTGAPYCRDKRCITEQNNSTIRGNLIAACSDEGIYINGSAASKILHNTVIDASGMSVRFPQSSADVEGNLIDGVIRTRDGAILRQNDNIETANTRLYLGSHPVRSLFRDAGNFDFTGKVPLRKDAAAGGIPDLCSGKVARQPAYGAFADFARCLR